MKRRLKNIFTVLSAFFCLAAMVAWGFGMVDLGFGYRSHVMNHGVAAYGVCGGVVLALIDFDKGLNPSLWDEYHYFGRETNDAEKRKFLLPSFHFWADTPWGHILVLPYWLLVLLFALAPVSWLRRRYVERRDKKFFEEIVAAKRAEQKAKE